ncbi:MULTISPECIES: methionine ABC transporter ATP-binding protein [Paenibacillus]|uniref:Methionine ABC transporter ATP-binding protein n=1 Tax=Paenibacillus odorifer TaxID=189426 RepID=A0A1R0WSM6_9BACL|nr:MULTISPECIES: methionine ABC transporter ATP-binding protein [Paenibacillus]AIQ75158.1 methionine ABC transporter ATP-binding protein [Paenibacillus odorifer]ETT46018.1 D-methionine transport ATP-binding protein metN [Paenibacillus sp. FSL H8-237]MDH6428043.1 D-methionine transport system ATP-binding protein [Paenibacillus sp. PastH-4]MDH6444327.1 D-methionine transport system ATP-binding protein [Paenibacillus sp. PastF-4]MDH6528228.1 D-methionine transport system ATP-binding protein [Paen
MIELKNVYKSFTRKGTTIDALKGIDLKVEKGDIFGVIGYSGAGKSTLIRLVNYLERPTKGQVMVAGRDLGTYNDKELRTAKKNIGMIFQHFNLLESKKVFDNVAIPLVLLKKNKNEIRQRVMELLEFVGLSDKAGSYPSELSGGQKQRVGIARALASNPSILLCDEATSALDPQTTHSILQLLKKINAEYNITVMIITHEMSVIQEICNKVAVMEEGRIIEQGSVLDVFGSPKHLTTQNFVKTVIQNSMTSSVRKSIKTEPGSQLYKLNFVGASASEPILFEMIRSCDIKVNILFANTTEIQETTLGTVIIQFDGEAAEINNALSFLTRNGVGVEEVESNVFDHSNR